MKDIRDFTYEESELLSELQRILVKYRYICSNKENITTSNATYMYRIKSALLKTKVKDKRIAILRRTIEIVNYKINNGMLFKEIFEPLPTIISDNIRKYSKTKKENETFVQEPDNENERLESNRKKLIAKSQFLDKVMDDALNRVEGYSRRDLLKAQTDCYALLKINTMHYGISNACAEVLGALNVGLIGCTKKHFKMHLYNKFRIVVKQNENMSDRMSDELLKYRVAALLYINSMCDSRLSKIRPKLDKDINYKQYEGLKEDIRFFGKVVREKYIDNYGISPKDELIENFIGGQISFSGLMSERDVIIRKRDFD